MLAAMISPFVLALLFAVVLEPPVRLLTGLLHNRRVAVVLTFGGFLLLTFGGAGLGLSHVAGELQRLLLVLAELRSQGWDAPWWVDSLQGFGAELAAGAAASLAGLVRATPSVMVALLVTLFATYYLCAEPDLPLRAVRLFAPAGWRGKTCEIYRRARASFSAYLLAQGAVMLASTLWAMLGLCLLGVDYVLLLGLLIGVCDLLPVLGPGTVLLPWSVLALLQGDNRLAGGLALIYVVILLSRQVIEPKILAAGLGLHPLAALLCGFVGLKLLGALGLLLGPLLASLFWFVYREYRSVDI